MIASLTNSLQLGTNLLGQRSRSQRDHMVR